MEGLMSAVTPASPPKKAPLISHTLLPTVNVSLYFTIQVTKPVKTSHALPTFRHFTCHISLYCEICSGNIVVVISKWHI